MVVQLIDLISALMGCLIDGCTSEQYNQCIFVCCLESTNGCTIDRFNQCLFWFASLMAVEVSSIISAFLFAA